MGTIADAIRIIWRDFNHDLVPSSGPYEPEKVHIREDLSAVLDHVSAENLGAPNGIATLDADGLLAFDQIPPAISSEVFDTAALGYAATSLNELYLVKGAGEVYATLWKNNGTPPGITTGLELASKAQWDALKVLLEAQAAIIDTDDTYSADLEIMTEDQYGNIGPGFIVNKLGGFQTAAFRAGDTGTIETELLGATDDEDGSFTIEDGYGNVALYIGPDGTARSRTFVGSGDVLLRQRPAGARRSGACRDGILQWNHRARKPNPDHH